MNKWTQQSIKLAKQRGYLDKLHEVYPVELSAERDIDDEVLGNLKRAFNSRDNAQLMKALLALDKFPRHSGIFHIADNRLVIEFNKWIAK